MKKLFITLAIILFAVNCFAAMASWTVVNPDNIPITGYSLEMWETNAPGVIIGRWNSIVMEQAIPDAKFMPGTSYSFRVLAYNASANSPWSETAVFTVSTPVYTPDAEIIPPDVSLPPVPPMPSGWEITGGTYIFERVIP